MSTRWQLLDAPRARCGGWGRWSGLWGRSSSATREVAPGAPLRIFQPTTLEHLLGTLQPIFSVNNHLLVNRLFSVRHLQRQIAWKLLKKTPKLSSYQRCACALCHHIQQEQPNQECCNKCCLETESDHDGGTRWPQGGLACFVNSGRARLVQSRGTCTKNAILAWTSLLLPLLQRPSTRYIVIVEIQHFSAKYAKTMQAERFP